LQYLGLFCLEGRGGVDVWAARTALISISISTSYSKTHQSVPQSIVPLSKSTDDIIWALINDVIAPIPASIYTSETL
jgi:hypothetical protein